MQDKAITVQPSLIEVPAENITPEILNLKARELGLAGARLIQAGTEMVTLAIELGGLLEAKAARVESIGGNWSEWCEENLEFSRQSGDNYRKLFRNRDAIALALEAGKINSIRQALAILSKEPGLETQPALPGLEDPRKSNPLSKTESIFSRIWRIFKEPAKAPAPERQALISHTAEAVRVCKEQGWQIPGVKTIELE